MDKLGTRTVVKRNGKIVKVKIEERYPYSMEILMKGGFPIILLNMIFGLLPTTLYGANLKYFRCSVAQLYALTFGVCMVLLSIIFVPVSVLSDLSDETDTRTGTAVMVIIRITHVCGFLLLVIRGHRVAKKIPLVWNQLSKLLQISIIDVHGRKDHFTKRILSFGRWSTFYYLAILVYAQIFTVVFEEETMVRFFAYYNLQPEFLSPLHFTCIQAAFSIWQFCSLSHVIVSMLVCYLIVVVRVCFRAINEQLMGMFDDGNESEPLLRKRRKWLKEKSVWDLEDESTAVENLNRVKDVMVVAEDITSTISRFWGISLIIEVLILIANLLVNLYYMLVSLNPQTLFGAPSIGNNETESSMGNGNEGQGPFKEIVSAIGLLNEAVIHSFFFYRLCCCSTDVVNETNVLLQILKSVPYQKYSGRVQGIIQTLKSDVSSTAVSLTAGNYFKINKFLLTSVTGAITTYIVVLLQFQAQEAN